MPLLLTLLAVWGTLELGLRHFYQLIPLKVCASDFILGSYYCQPYFVYDKPVRLAYWYKPGLKLEGYWDPADPYLTDVGPETRPSDRSDTFLYIFETDEMGFPNSQYKWQDSYDIVVTGDSFVTRSAPQTWIELLSAQTGQDILTLGASSWTTLNEVEAVKMYGLDKQPDWVMLLYFEGNDLINIQQYLDKQASGLNWREYDMQGVPWYRRLVTYHLARFALQNEESSPEPPHYRYPVTVTTDWGPMETVLKDVHLLPMSASYETLARSDEYAAMTTALLELDGLVKARGGRFLLVFVPSKEDLYWSRLWNDVDVNNVLERTVTVTLSEGDHGRLQWTPQYISYDEMNINHDAQSRLFADFTAANNIEFLDLTPALWQKTIQEGEFYHYADPHWNQAGNQLVADLIQAYMADK
ncbi:MAG: hypothetical protein H6662_05195 [Ardenticatenaceae bacterium]|nr:hypothetical protein [Anaerolineales bacterium]MCB8920963.1 hypothetical protein [Ardenticatenaceae bacterium]MCB8991611.1 hypothetical protein [Ardenticatenaceae bacterium]